MLSNVHVKNFALIDEADIELSDNLNILTGETGAGKSILLGAINLALGARTSKDAIRTNADYALAELTFADVSKNVEAKLEELGIEPEDGTVTVSRKLMQNGKSVVRLNGETVSSAAARSVTSLLIDIYGQNEHQSLLDVSEHLLIIDRFAGEEVRALKEQTAASYRVYASLKKEHEALDDNPVSRQREISRLNAEIDEIENARLCEGEDIELKDEFRRLSNTDQIRESLIGACDALYRNDGCSDLISNAIHRVSKVSEYDDKLAGFAEELNELDERISDIYRELSDYLEELPDGTQRLNEVGMRLELIASLKNKYGYTIEQINEVCEENRAALEKLNSFEAYEQELAHKLKQAQNELEDLSTKLSLKRKEAAGFLEKKITGALKELNFNSVLFNIVFDEREGFHQDGRDRAEFMISLNPGEKPGPLAKIASGGELSRIMLAIKSVLADKETIDSLIFDEVDTGISGITAQKVAERLAVISNHRQVICITHLPQIASMADVHFLVSKNVEDASTRVSIARIDRTDSIKELARIMSGENPSESVLEAAAEIKTKSDGRKKEIREVVIK